MDFSTTTDVADTNPVSPERANARPYPEVFGNASLGNFFASHIYKRWAKFGLPVAMLIVFAIGCISPFWFSGKGTISNARIHRNAGVFALPGWRFGSTSFYLKKGQSATLVVDVHEVKHGAMEAGIYCHGRFDRRFKKSARMLINSTGKKTINLVAKESCVHHLDFKPRGKIKSSSDVFSGGKTDIRYSAKWEVKY